MTIAFPDGVSQRIEAIARLRGYASAAEYLMKLVEDAEAESAAEQPMPPEVSPKDRAELEAMLDAGMNSGPPIQATPAFWEERKRAQKGRDSTIEVRPPGS